MHQTSRWQRLWVAGVAVAAVAGVVACSGSVCDRTDSTFNSVPTKAGNCFDGGVKVTLQLDKANCDANISKCTSDDVTKMNVALDCLDKVPTCVAGGETAWSGAITACAVGLSAVSATCSAALSNIPDAGH